MKHLFCVRLNTQFNKSIVTARDCPIEILEKACMPIYHLDPVYFESKQDAKALRDHLSVPCEVSKGPDHIGNHGHNVAMMRRQPPHRQYGFKSHV